MIKLSRQTRSYLTVIGTSFIYFAMGLYFAAGSTGVYLTSYLIYRAKSDMKVDDAIWFLSMAGFSALLLPAGGWLGNKLGVRAVCLIGGLLQSCGIFLTYYALDTTFFWVVIVYGGSFLVSLASCYTTPMVNVCKWHPNHKGLVSGIGAASMALAPTLFTPLITYLVNPNNVPPNSMGLFDDTDVLKRTKDSTIIQGLITMSLFALGISITFPAEQNDEQTSKTRIIKSFVGSCEELNQPNVILTGYTMLNSTRRNKSQKHHAVFFPNRPIKNDDIEEPKRANNSAQRPIEDFSIEPKFAFRTQEFWLLSLKVLISELIFIYLLFMYKPYGQIFIKDDYFLSAVGAACAVSNTLGRLTMGHVKDKIGYRAVSIPSSALTMTFVALMPVTKYLNKSFYGIGVVVAVGAVGSQYALMPSAAQDSFGDKYASINIGFVYMSTVIATVSSALLTQNLTSLIGWDGMILTIAAFAAIDFGTTFMMPRNPKKQLMKRYNQFYNSTKKNGQYEEGKSIGAGAA